MSTFEQYYDINPVAVVDQNQWDERIPEVGMQFRTSSVYTPLIDWTDEPSRTGAATTWRTELMEPDVNSDEIPMDANYIDAMGVDSRMRSYTVSRYGDKVQLHKKSNIFQQWKLSGGRDWRPLLRGVLGNSIVRKMEVLARNAHLGGPKNFWTYAGGATSFATIGSDDVFNVDVVNDWNLRLGNTGSPIIPGDLARAKVAIVPPGVVYDFRKSLASASGSEAALYRDARIYAAEAINFEIGTYNGVRFVTPPNDQFGFNPAVLYNAGAINKQYGVTARIDRGDGAPDPETTAVDATFYVGQKNRTHYIQLEDFADGHFSVGDIVTIHRTRTTVYGVTGGVNPLEGTAVHRRIVSVDHSNNRLTFDRPIMWNYHASFADPVGSVTGATPGTFYAYVTKARHIGFVLTLGARGGILGAVAEPLEFYEPKPVDDFDSVWRFSWDAVLGHNVWEPNYFECHFCAVSLPKAGGIITP